MEDDKEFKYEIDLILNQNHDPSENLISPIFESNNGNNLTANNNTVSLNNPTPVSATPMNVPFNSTSNYNLPALMPTPSLPAPCYNTNNFDSFVPLHGPMDNLNPGYALYPPTNNLNPNYAVNPPMNNFNPGYAVHAPMNNFNPSYATPLPTNNFNPSYATPPPTNNFNPSYAIPPPTNNFNPSYAIPPPMNNLNPSYAVHPPINNFNPGPSVHPPANNLNTGHVAHPLDPNWEAINAFLAGQVRPGTDVDRVFHCGVCNVEFANAQALGGHMSSHTKNRKQKEGGSSTRGKNFKRAGRR